MGHFITIMNSYYIFNPPSNTLDPTIQSVLTNLLENHDQMWVISDSSSLKNILKWGYELGDFHPNLQRHVLNNKLLWCMYCHFSYLEVRTLAAFKEGHRNIYRDFDTTALLNEHIFVYP